MNTIFWKGVFSTTIDGLLISELPPISKPPLRVKETTIDGRDGSIIEELGYSSYDKAITIGLHGNFNINKVIKYFTGEGEIIFGNEPDKVYTAKIVDQIDYNRLLRFRTAVVKFRVQPFKHKYNEAYKETQTATATGTNIVVTDSAEANLKAFSIYGKSTQNGTPTPTAPIDIVSLCADGTIAVTVNDAESVLAVSKLRGIPVTDKKLATYTDANGQMWCADEIDLVRGVYVKRINSVVLDSTELFKTSYSGAFVLYRTDVLLIDKDNQNKLVGIMCDCYQATTWVSLSTLPQDGVALVWGNGLAVRDSRFGTVDDFNDYLAKNPITVQYILATPIETALTEEELAVCNAIKAVSQDTVIANDDGAYMKVEYFKPFEVFNEGLESSKPKMVLRGSGTVEISVNGIHIFDYTFPEGENEVVIDSEKEDAYLGEVLKNRHMNGEFPVLLAGTNKIEWYGDVESIEILPRSRWL